ncbi:MAG: hypothetical protein GY789_20600 [Hyphomicrobiales bacterium]|nr:hypothetical protein [Hyphomicrobiales bacterium]MCP4999505.1 hypothetical protein [Hyphomicrobiales bacterium]
MTVLSGCNTTDGSVRMQEGYVLKDVTPSHGTVLSPLATVKSDCEVLVAEVARMDEIVKPISRPS